MKFEGFMGEDLEVKITKDSGQDHHHLEVWHLGKMLWYAHLFKDEISLWGSLHIRNVNVNNVRINIEEVNHNANQEGSNKTLN